MSAQLGELVPLRTARHVLRGDHGCCLRAAQSLEDEIRLLRQQAAARRLQPRPAPGNELLDYLRTLEPCAVAELTAGADSDILGAPLPPVHSLKGAGAKPVRGGKPWSVSGLGVIASWACGNVPAALACKTSSAGERASLCAARAFCLGMQRDKQCSEARCARLMCYAALQRR